MSNPTPPGTKPPRKQKAMFTHEEDQKLRELVQLKGTHAWNEIQEQMPNRTARQCRERWNLYLSPDVSNTPWTKEEEALLMKFYRLVGPKWSVIAKNFPNRTANNVKNHTKQFLRRTQKYFSQTFGYIPIQAPAAGIVISTQEPPLSEVVIGQTQPQ
ncbi:Myb-like DNA-binding domain containing protein [Histomonas meleagridis]|uniref:Myb-like DNA-binding domain containing protein n=1 Tax=Histomonas meleagridis TaxID=135588 RepID=UPI00355A31B1|nr:Myb-like DNA-binding domain containing protein [Histomonas meleagridis]KAH0803916.1 Myb-like DNA-binding domain containing protein [Histomonas meleagridis]